MTNQAAQQRPDEVAVNEQGRVTIPAEMRRAAGIEPGQSVYMHVQGGAVVVETRETYAARIRREIAAQWSGDPDTSVVDELAADRRADAAREDGAA